MMVLMGELGRGWMQEHSRIWRVYRDLQYRSKIRLSYQWLQHISRKRALESLGGWEGRLGRSDDIELNHIYIMERVHRILM